MSMNQEVGNRPNFAHAPGILGDPEDPVKKAI